jgi:TonB family protein
MGWEGRNRVRVKIGADGLVEGVTVSQKSGPTGLDDRAAAKVRSVALPVVPEQLRERAFSLEVPFRFHLRGRPKDAAEAKGLVLPGPSLK